MSASGTLSIGQLSHRGWKHMRDGGGSYARHDDGRETKRFDTPARAFEAAARAEQGDSSELTGHAEPAAAVGMPPLPDGLREAGWSLEYDEGKWRCRHAPKKLCTNSYETPEGAFRAAAGIQRTADKHGGGKRPFVEPAVEEAAAPPSEAEMLAAHRQRMDAARGEAAHDPSADPRTCPVCTSEYDANDAGQAEEHALHQEVFGVGSGAPEGGVEGQEEDGADEIEPGGEEVVSEKGSSVMRQLTADKITSRHDLDAAVSRYRLDEIETAEGYTLADRLCISERLGRLRAEFGGGRPAGEVEEAASEAAPPSGQPSLIDIDPLRRDEVVPAVFTYEEIHPSKIEEHPLLLMRARGLNEQHVQDLQEVLRQGKKFKDPVVLFRDGSKYWPGSGNHRRAAALREGKLLDADVRKGSFTDALKFAAGSNAFHGLKPTDDDKRLTVLALLFDEEVSRESDTTIAELAQVTQPFVGGSIQRPLEKLLPLLIGQRYSLGDGEAGANSDEKYAAETGAPLGLVPLVRRFSTEELERLSHNIMGRAEKRLSRDGVVRTVKSGPAEAPLLEAAGVAETFEDDTRRAATSDLLDPSGNLEVEALEEERAREAFDPVNEANQEEADRRERERVTAGHEERAAGPDSSVVVQDRSRFADEAQTSSAPSPPPAPEPQRPPSPALEELLAGRSLGVNLVWIPGVPGVQASVIVGGDVAGAARRLLPPELARQFPDALLQLIRDQLRNVPKKPAPNSGAHPAADELVRVINAVTDPKGLEKLVVKRKLDDLSAYPKPEAARIRRVLAERRAALAPKPTTKPAAKKAPSKAPAKKSAAKKVAAKKGAGVKPGRRK
jgi:hypothetical protein